MINIGIDPGRHGAYAIMDGGEILCCHPFPYIGEELDIGTLSIDIIQHTHGKPRVAILEKVHAMPGQGVCSMFTFGRNVGEIRGMLKTIGIGFREPTPQQWKKAVLAGQKQDKAAAVAHVMRRYPEIDLKPGKKRVAHDGMADAVCLAEFGGMR